MNLVCQVLQRPPPLICQLVMVVGVHRSSSSDTRAAPAEVSACRAYTGCSRVLGRLCACQKGVASRSKVPNGPRRQQSDSMRGSPSCRLHDNPRDASHRLPRLSRQRNALRRQFDDVRRMDPVDLSRLQFDQDDQPTAPSVRAIHAGDHRPVVTRPEHLLRVGERVILQRLGHPLIQLHGAPASNACRSPGRHHAGDATAKKKPELSRWHGFVPDRRADRWQAKPTA